jgi:hypothetical protein
VQGRKAYDAPYDTYFRQIPEDVTQREIAFLAQLADDDDDETERMRLVRYMHDVYPGVPVRRWLDQSLDALVD